jgi:hypothetical protein
MTTHPDATADQWELAYGYQIKVGDRVSFEEDAIDALKGTGDMGPADIDWSYVHQFSDVVTGVRREAPYWRITVEGQNQPGLGDDSARLLRYTGPTS